jgi:hypothetical protein
METSGDQAAQQQHDQAAQQNQQHSSAQLPALRVPAALLAHSSIARDQELVLTLLQASKQLQAAAAAECAGQLAVNVGLYERQSPKAQAFAAWLQHHAGLLRELHVELRCLGSDASAVLQSLQEQQQQLQALQCLALVSDSNVYTNSLQDAWADPLLPHLPVGLRRLQLTGSNITAQGDALAALSRLQQLTQLTIGWPIKVGLGASLSSEAIQLQHLPEGLRSLDLTCCEGWDEDEDPDALAPLSRLQQLTELRVGKVQPQQLGQLPPVLQQLDVTLLASVEDHKEAAAWYQQHANIVRRLVLDGGEEGMRWKDLSEYLEDGWDDVLDAFPEAFNAVAQAATAAAAAELRPDSTQLPASRATGTATVAARRTPAPQQTFPSAANSSGSSTSTSSKLRLQSLRVVHMPWLLGESLSSLPASSLTELECSVNSGCEQLVASLSSLTALHSLRILYSATWDDYSDSLMDLPDSAFAPLSALLQLTQLQLGHVRAQQLPHLELPQLQQLRAVVARVYPVWKHDQPHQLFDISHLSSLTLLHIHSSWMQGDGFSSSLRAVTWEFPLRMSSNPEVAKMLSAEMDLRPLLQLGALEKVHFIFYDLISARLQHGLLHARVYVQDDWRCESIAGQQMVWRTAAGAAAQDVVGDAQPAAAAAEASWAAGPLKSVRLMYDKLQHGFASMPTATVQALGALQLTELAIHGGSWFRAHLGLEVTPAQLAEVLQHLPLLQRLELEYFALLCDAEFAEPADVSALPAAVPAQQQQQQQQPMRMQPYHSAAGVAALVSAIGQLHKLQAMQLELPLLLRPTTEELQEVESALERWLPFVQLQNNVQHGSSSLFVLCRKLRR